MPCCFGGSDRIVVVLLLSVKGSNTWVLLLIFLFRHLLKRSAIVSIFLFCVILNFVVAARQLSLVYVTSLLIIVKFIKRYTALQLDVCQGRKSVLIIIIPMLIHIFWSASAAWEFWAIALVDKTSDLRQAIDVNFLHQPLIFKLFGEHIKELCAVSDGDLWHAMLLLAINLSGRWIRVLPFFGLVAVVVSLGGLPGKRVEF